MRESVILGSCNACFTRLKISALRVIGCVSVQHVLLFDLTTRSSTSCTIAQHVSVLRAVVFPPPSSIPSPLFICSSNFICFLSKTQLVAPVAWLVSLFESNQLPRPLVPTLTLLYRERSGPCNPNQTLSASGATVSERVSNFDVMPAALPLCRLSPGGAGGLSLVVVDVVTRHHASAITEVP